MHIANHYKIFQWKQPRRLDGARQFETNHLSGLGIDQIGRNIPSQASEE